MFNLFKKQFIDESIEEQKEDLTVLQQLATTNGDFIKTALSGESCDELKNITGDFGRVATNPIPVNGPLGEIKYLNRIRSSDGCGFIFHRIGSTQQFGINGNIDIFMVLERLATKFGINELAQDTELELIPGGGMHFKFTSNDFCDNIVRININ